MQFTTAMVEVFKTNVQDTGESKRLIRKILEHFQIDKVSFDLEDCDKVLRVEGKFISPNKIIELLLSFGYQCEILVG
ncbi:hypothetical protein [Spirosoma sp. KNUC1025]|uniref:hypothetical protein n=1 Tax=Spirosoma sp. KNUC1025 TaxID=2894082 RepID=UPI00386A18E2|nr:hypothetical protein LN737_29015 [Spirosoma sp. KNUC1025]